MAIKLELLFSHNICIKAFNFSSLSLKVTVTDNLGISVRPGSTD